MLSVAMLSNGFARAAVAVMSPERNPCRVHAVEPEGTVSSLYRFDPYASKVLPSPLKTQLISPIKCPVPVEMPPQAVDEAPLHRNSLFTKPVLSHAASAPRLEHPALKPIEPIGAPILTEPKVKTSESAKTHYAVVYFKHDSATYIAPFRIATGDHVIVEGDRGVDLGRVTEITTVTPRYNVPNKIVRRATKKDMEAFEEKHHKEQLVRAQVQGMVEQQDLGVQIVDTEFQFDNNKLTVFFAGRTQIDFRKLQRLLFREHRCRIWLSNMAEIEYKAAMQKAHRTR